MARLASVALMVAITWLALSGPLRAQMNPPFGEDALVPSYRPDRVLQQVPLTGELPMSLRDAIAIGLVNNLDVEVERYEPLLTQQDAEGSWGAFDPEGFADIGYASTRSPVANPLQGDPLVKTKKTDGRGGLRGLIPYLGANYDIVFDGSTERTNVSIQSLSPELTSNLTVSGSIPLLRGLIWNEAWTNVKVSDLVNGIAREQFVTQVMNTVQLISDSYWRLVAAKDQVRVADTSLETSKALLDQTQTQYEVGVVSRVAVVEAEAGVAERDFDLIVTTNAYEDAQDVLIDTVLGPNLTAGSDLEIVPIDDPENFVPFKVDPERSVRLAFAKRPELKAARTEIERSQVSLKFAKNERLPQFDVRLSYGLQGLAGTSNPARLPIGPGDEEIDLTVGPGWDDTFDVWDDTNSFTARGVFSIPLTNTTARKRVVRNKLELQRSKTRTRRLEQTIILEIRRAVRDLNSALEGIEAAERRRIATAEQLRAQKIRLEHGESTPFEVFERERDLTQAESQKIDALRVYRESVAGLERSQGTILEKYNVMVPDVRIQPLKNF